MIARLGPRVQYSSMGGDLVVLCVSRQQPSFVHWPVGGMLHLLSALSQRKNKNNRGKKTEPTFPLISRK